MMTDYDDDGDDDDGKDMGQFFQLGAAWPVFS